MNELLYSYTYDEDKNEIESKSFYWVSSSEEWKVEYNTEYNYINGNLSQELVYQNSEPYQKRLYIYNSDNLLTSRMYGEYNSADEEFEYTSYYKYSYDENNQLVARLILSYKIDWYEYAVDSFYYDNTGNLTLNTYYFIQKEKYSSREEYTYDENNNLIEYIDYSSYDNDAKVFTSADMYVYEYDSENLLTQYIYYDWDGDVTWTQKNKSEYTYSDTSETHFTYIWDSDAAAWATTYKITTVYDPDVALSSLILPYGSSQEIKKEYYFAQKWDDDSQEWENSSRYLYYYSEQINTSDISEETIDNSGLSFIVYPNPANSFINIDFAECQDALFELYNLQGKMVLESNLTENTQIDIDFLNRGMYFYKITTDSQSVSGRLIKH